MSKRKIGVNPSVAKPEAELSTTSKLLSRSNLVSAGIILALALIVFWRTTENGFTDWDDDLYVVKSDLIRQLNWTSFKSYFTTLTANLYTPLVTLSYAIDFKIHGMNASGFHLTNLLLHIVNILLVYVLTFLLFKKTFVAALTALLFSIHPLQTEAVIWISSRKDLLFTFFYLLGLIAYIRYLSRKQNLMLVLTFVLFILSVLSKPIAFTFPLVLLWIDYFNNKTISKKEFFQKIPFFVVSVAVGIMGVYLVREYDVFATAPAGYSLFDKFCLAAYALAFYLYNAFIPTGISNYHEYPFKDSTFLDAGYVLSPLLILLLLFVLYRGLRKNFVLVSGLIVFLVIIGPTLRLVPTGYPIAADRYFYLASIGLFWSVILTMEKIASYSFPLRSVALALSSGLILAFIIVSYKRVPDWKDSYSLWNSILKKNLYHEIANNHLGRLYDTSGDKDRAFVHFQRVIERNKTQPDIMNSVGNILIERKRPEDAMRYFDLAIATGRADHLPYYNRGMVYSDRGEFKKAIADFDNAVKQKPDFAEGYNNRGIAKVKSGDTLGAYKDFSEAVRFNPNDQTIQDNLLRIRSMLTPVNQ